MEPPAVVSHQPPPSLEELSSLELRLAKGALSQSETLAWLSRLIAAYKALLPDQPPRETPSFSAPRAEG